jgi:hypothetical protein
VSDFKNMLSNISSRLIVIRELESNFDVDY